MLSEIKKLFRGNEILNSNYGIEREVLRLQENGSLSKENHPAVFGDKLQNPYITTDFSESQMEFITPTFSDIKELYDFTNSLYDIASLEIGNEYLWPQSMPNIITDEDEIPLAIFNESEMGKQANNYRENLIKKYGAKRQLICGIHYNFSFNEAIIKKLYQNNKENSGYRYFKDKIYLKVARNYLRYRWLLIYLFGASGIIHESYKVNNKSFHNEINCYKELNQEAISFRNSEYGYKNNIELLPNYQSVNDYVESIRMFIDDGVISSSKELYSPVRLKAKDPKDLINSLNNDGIKYLEFRNIDINPFEKGGVSMETLEFMQIFNIFLLVEDESDYEKWQTESNKNQDLISKHGEHNIILNKDGNDICRVKWSLEILRKMSEINDELKLDFKKNINTMKDKVLDYKKTYSYMIKNEIEKDGYLNAHLKYAKKYKKLAYENRFGLTGFEDLELSTQILLKESIKKGISFEIIDRSENFIKLKSREKIEYVKQATKTSKDNYVSVLLMENKSTTKHILREHNVRVPEGIEVHSIDEGIEKLYQYENKPIVIKPKSTNFGLGISIFNEGTDFQNISEALKIAFKYDNTVLIEEFIKGKEYRFLVVGDKVVGILHRVPANVLGDGKNGIKELVELKNQNPLRGYHYVKPLEKIKLDENAILFLKNQGKSVDYIPKKDEIVYLRENSNISTGGDSIDFTDIIPQKYKKIAVDAAKAVGAKICGVDMIIENYKNDESSYGIIELNFNPAIHIHCYPYEGKERNIGMDILKILGF